MITLSTSKPVSPFGRDLKGTFAALQSLLRTKAINFTLRLATIPFRSRRNNIDLIRGALAKGSIHITNGATSSRKVIEINCSDGEVINKKLDNVCNNHPQH
jgi:hypothetical protein